MEAGSRKLGGRPLFASLVPDTQNLDTVRALHQTVVALRVALEKSRAELQALRVKVQTHIDTSVYVATIEKLSLENHILRQRVINEGLELPEYASRDPKPAEVPVVTLSPVPEHMEAVQAEKENAAPSGLLRGNEEEGSVSLSPKEASERSEGPEAKKPATGSERSDCSSEQKAASESGEKAAETDERAEEAAKNGREEAKGREKTVKLGEWLQPMRHGRLVTVVTPRSPSDLSAFEDSDAPPQNGVSPGSKPGAGDSGDESEELDDIELIFTTEETKELGVLQEDLVPIADGDPWTPGGEADAAAGLLKFADAEDGEPTDGAEEEEEEEKGGAGPGAGKGGGGGGGGPWTHSVLVETDISKCGVVDEAEALQLTRLARRNTMPAPLLFPAYPAHRGGSGAPSPSGPRPLAVKFAAGGGPAMGRRGTDGDCQRYPARPILVERSAAKRESEAQTDITALPPHWKSESSLAQKVASAHGGGFTTLPSKFALPLGGGGGGGGGGGPRAALGGRYALRLTDKTQEARRTLLSDINFTSMVPELSRSADHLCQEEVLGGPPPHAGGALVGMPGVVDLSGPGLLRHYPRAYSYMKNADFGLGSNSPASPGYGLSRDNSKDGWSPCTCSHGHFCGPPSRTSWESCPSCHAGGSATRFRGGSCGIGGGGSLSSIPASECNRRRHSWRPEIRSCGALPHQRSWGSVPSSPTHIHCGARGSGAHLSTSFSTQRSDVSLFGGGGGSGGGSQWMGPADSQFSIASRNSGRRLPGGSGKLKTAHRVTFEEAVVPRRVQPGTSLPDLRNDWEHDSGESTDSLIDEAEEYLRRSIDSILTGADVARVSRRRTLRRFSEPDPVRELTPPQSAQPFLPKVPRDLKLDFFVKVITAEGRVMVGRVRYVGPVPNRMEPHVGVELPKASGDSDGSFQGRRYFDCDPDCGLFVPFKKVVMAWSV